MDIIKEFLIFDDSSENYNLKGGVAIATKVASSPQGQKAMTQAASGAANKSGDTGDAGGAGNNESNNSNNKDLEKVNESSLFGDFGGSIIETVRETFKKFKSFILGYFIIPVMFGSFAPALPFFVVMAAMFAIMKYLMGFFRKL
jgi:hypothetical protein